MDHFYVRELLLLLSNRKELFHCRFKILTPYLKDLIQKRQKVSKEKSTSLFKIYRNRVNSERKAAKSKYYQSKIEHLKDTDPKKWWSICKNICGTSRANDKLLETESPSIKSKIKLPNDINSAHLKPLQITPNYFQAVKFP